MTFVREFVDYPSQKDIALLKKEFTLHDYRW